MPECGGNGSVRLAGDDEFKNVRFGCEFLHQRVRGIESERLDTREVLQDWENILVRGTDRQLKTGAAELQLRAALEKMPGEAGAECHGALKPWIANLGGSRDFVSSRKMRI